jgi:hypothetical protein
MCFHFSNVWKDGEDFHETCYEDHDTRENLFFVTFNILQIFIETTEGT